MKCLTYENLDIRKLNQDAFRRIRKTIPIHGVICLRQQALSTDDQIALTRCFGESVLLPAALRHNSTQNQNPELTKVSNILPDGSLNHAHKAAEYWHSDGDFWQPGRNYLFNLLHSLIVPDQGGATEFADLRLAYASLDDKIKQRIRNLQVIVSCDNIPVFEENYPDERQPDAIHAITHRHVETGQVGLYFGHTFATILGISKEESEEIVGNLVNAIEQPENQYVHEWQQGDLLIWDNTSVMHRSIGDYGDLPRLLHRTQAFVKPLTEADAGAGAGHGFNKLKTRADQQDEEIDDAQ